MKAHWAYTPGICVSLVQYQWTLSRYVVNDTALGDNYFDTEDDLLPMRKNEGALDLQAWHLRFSISESMDIIYRMTLFSLRLHCLELCLPISIISPQVALVVH